MVHFDIENPDPYEKVVTVKRTASSKMTNETYYTNESSTVSYPENSLVQELRNGGYDSDVKNSLTLSTPSSSSAKVQEEKTAEFTSAVNHSYAETVKVPKDTKNIYSDEHAGVEVISYSKEISSGVQNSNKTSTYYQSVHAFLENKSISQYAKLLVFKYEKMKEFPAIAYLHRNMVCVEPIVAGAEAFEFSVSEIEKAKEVQVTGLDMEVMDNEFLTCSLSNVGKEFEDLLPEYSLDNHGVYRTQYVFECGMIITENSMEELRKIVS